MDQDGWDIRVYEAGDGGIPVQEFLDALPVKKAQKVLRDIDVLETYGLRWGMPHVRSLPGGMYELRTEHGSDIFRTFFFHWKHTVLVLTMGIRKSRKRWIRRNLNGHNVIGRTGYKDTEGRKMSFVRDYVRHRAQADPAFQQVWEDGTLEREIAKQLIGIRLELGMTQAQFAERVGVKQSFLSRLENGEQNLTMETLQRLAQRAGVTVHVRLALLHD